MYSTVYQGSVVLPVVGFNISQETKALMNERGGLEGRVLFIKRQNLGTHLNFFLRQNRTLIQLPLLTGKFIFRSSLCSKCCCRSSLFSSTSDTGPPFSRTIYSRTTESCLINHKTEQTNKQISTLCDVIVICRTIICSTEK
jgi:hypothetical protein